MSDTVIATYSDLAARYDEQRNLTSCWGQAADEALGEIHVSPDDRLVVDVGCGTGRALRALAAGAHEHTRFVGVEPAEGMRQLAASTTGPCRNVRIIDGRFEKLPFDRHSIDYLYSIFAFHWTTDLEASVGELSRVLKPDGAMDLFFIGRHNGREFIQATSRIFLRYLGAKGLLEASVMRKQLTLAEAEELFSARFDRSRLRIEEQRRTYFDTLDGHWGWWVRIEGQFVRIPPERRQACDAEVKAALSALNTDRAIPYTLHRLHVSVRHGE